MKHFLTGQEFSPTEQKEIIKLAIDYKKGIRPLPDFAGKILTLIFANPSLRTRLSFESGMKKAGGQVNVLNAGDSWDFEYAEGATMDGNTQEHIKEAAPVVASYSDLIGLRKCDLMNKERSALSTWSELKKDEALNQLAKYSSKPVINLESNLFHPCQSIADMQTITENLGQVKGKKFVLTWAPHPKPLPLATAHSQLLTPLVFGMEVTLSHPPGFNLDRSVLQMTQNFDGKLTITNNQEEALQGAEVVVAKSWASLEFFGEWEQEKKHRLQFNDWIIDQKKMDLTKEAIFMHCLPIRRNIVATDEVLESSKSKIIEGAENRMWSQIAIISKLLQ
jgi:N-acetylornithine carbamoyltransferase